MKYMLLMVMSTIMFAKEISLENELLLKTAAAATGVATGKAMDAHYNKFFHKKVFPEILKHNPELKNDPFIERYIRQDANSRYLHDLTMTTHKQMQSLKAQMKEKKELHLKHRLLKQSQASGVLTDRSVKVLDSIEMRTLSNEIKDIAREIERIDRNFTGMRVDAAIAKQNLIKTAEQLPAYIAKKYKENALRETLRGKFLRVGGKPIAILSILAGGIAMVEYGMSEPVVEEEKVVFDGKIDEDLYKTDPEKVNRSPAVIRN